MSSDQTLTFLNEHEYNDAIEDFSCQPSIGPAEGRFVKSLESCVLVVGPARVGKSTLIKALTGDQKVETSPGIDPHTEKMARYTVQMSLPVIGSEAAPKRPFHFWDTPGITEWSIFTKTLNSFLDRARPLAIMICLAPGTDADSQAWISLIKQCTRRSMALCLVITNKFTGNEDQYTEILDFYKSQSLGHPLPRPSDCPSSMRWNEDDVWHYTHGSIVGVNSETYENIRTNSVIGPRNLDVLAYSIARQLDENMLAEWFSFLVSNPGFLRRIWHLTDWFFSKKAPSITQSLKAWSCVGRPNDYDD